MVLAGTGVCLACGATEFVELISKKEHGPKKCASRGGGERDVLPAEPAESPLRVQAARKRARKRSKGETVEELIGAVTGTSGGKALGAIVGIAVDLFGGPRGPWDPPDEEG